MVCMRYMSVIGDGDSSVMAKFRACVPYGIYVEKIECANHTCKAYRSRLESLAKDNSQYQGKGGLTEEHPTSHYWSKNGYTHALQNWQCAVTPLHIINIIIFNKHMQCTIIIHACISVIKVTMSTVWNSCGDRHCVSNLYSNRHSL